MSRLAEHLARYQRIVFFTGAGASTEPPTSLPDFRSSTGLWKNRTLMQTLTRGTFFEDPEGFWLAFRDVFLPWKDVQPNPVHKAPARLAALGKQVGVVTQNIDGLDARCSSGYPVHELHGHLRSAACPECGKRVSTDRCETGIPTCDCGAVLKPDVVLFDDPLDFESVFLPARDLIGQAEFLVVVGTSLAVAPANMLVLERRGLPMAMLNRDPTPYDDLAVVVERRPAGVVLDEALAILERARS
ncbi:MAG: Sir2 family NAD-dependent protein deacetylase [Myxococcales bacterium]